MRSALGSSYDRWLTTEPEYNYDEPPLKCGTCGRFVSRKQPLRQEPWEEGWDCDGTIIDAGFTWCGEIRDAADKCWQEGWSAKESTEHNAEHHKHLKNLVSSCGAVAKHEPHHVVEWAGTNYFYQCSGGHEVLAVVS